MCSTGAFIGSVNGSNYKLIIENAKKIHCDGFEFMLYPSWYDVMNQLVYDLKAIDIMFPIVHVDKQVGEMISRNEKNYIEFTLELFDKKCRIAKVLGLEKLVLHLWGWIPSDRDIITILSNLKNFMQFQKAVSWALREIGKRDFNYQEKAILLAHELKESGSKSQIWIAKDELKELEKLVEVEGRRRLISSDSQMGKEC